MPAVGGRAGRSQEFIPNKWRGPPLWGIEMKSHPRFGGSRKNHCGNGLRFTKKGPRRIPWPFTDLSGWQSNPRFRETLPQQGISCHSFPVKKHSSRPFNRLFFSRSNHLAREERGRNVLFLPVGLPDRGFHPRVDTPATLETGALDFAPLFFFRAPFFRSPRDATWDE